jgi:hypothetical protein
MAGETCGSAQVPTASSPSVGSVLTDEILLQICRIRLDEAESMLEQMADLRSIPQILGHDPDHSLHLGLAVTIVTSALGQVPRHNPVHLPFGYSGPRVQSHYWIDQTTVDRVTKQIVGLVFHDRDPDAIAVTIEHAITEAVRLGFVDQKQYDAWQPGMASGSGWRYALMATPYGVTKARAARQARSNQPSRASSASVLPKAQVTTSEIVTTPTTPPSLPVPDHQAVVAASGETFEWARQAELVRATNQVLGSDMLNKGVLSRASASRKIESNGKTGPCSRIRVASFLVWVVRQFSLGTDEQTQIRNAIIGEINSRKP